MSVHFSHYNLTATKTLVDPIYYLNLNEDVREADIDPVTHFIDYGYNENRAPSKWFNRSYLNRVAADEGYNLSNATTLVDSLFDAGRQNYQWASPCVNPAWILHQLPEARTLGDTLKALIPESGISIHPALRKVYPSTKKITINDILKNIHELDYKQLSLVDLDEYVYQHRDIQNTTRDEFQIFEHLWGQGYIQNRLKYLGVKRKNDTNENTLLRAHLAVAISTATGLDETDTFKSISGLGNTIKMLDRDHPAVQPILAFAEDRLNNVPSYEQLFDVCEATSMARTTLRVPAPEVFRAKRITDIDLISGRIESKSPRVVYSVCTQAHDGIPTPPDIQDCDFYLISDVAGLPKDSPWQLVTPTLSDRDSKRGALWFKTHPHVLFPQKDFATWIDANIVCKTASENVLCAHEAISEVATFVHGDRNCVYEEASKIKDLMLDHSDVIERSIEKLSAAGMPKRSGLYETNVLFSQCGDMLVRNFFNEWWRQIWLGSRRDQMSFTLAAWLTDLTVSPLDGPKNAKNSRFFSKISHRTTATRTVGTHSK